MKKGLLILLLLSTVVLAQQEATPIPRYTDFPLDNIHILRLQEAAESISDNVSTLQAEIAGFKTAQTEELKQMHNALNEFKRIQTTQLAGLQEQMNDLQERIGRQPRTEVPESRIPSTVVTLLSVNILMLFIVILLVLYLRGKYTDYLKAKKEASQHIHPAPENLVDHVKSQLKKKKSLHDIRMELAEKGWNPSVIEHAIHAAKE